MDGSGDGESFGRLLRRARLVAGMTQEDLAARSGLSVRTISQLERDRSRRPYFRSVGLLTDALEAPAPVRSRLLEAASRVWQGAEKVQESKAHIDSEPDAYRTGSSAGPGSWTMPRQLPFTVCDFTGRIDEVARLTAALSARGGAAAGVPVAVISGQPGIGKTTLALYVAHSLSSLFPDGQLWVQLAGASARPRDPGEVLGELLRAVGVHASAIPAAADERAGLFRSQLADRQVLLVLDDAASSAQVRPLLPGTAGSAVLATSRTRLSGLPGVVTAQLEVFTQAEAVELLTRMAGQERMGAEPDAVRELAAACGLMPLAVRIAGARLAARTAWPVALLSRRMTDQQQRLDQLESEDLSVRVSFGLSYEALSDPAKRAFRLLGLLGRHDIAEWVCAALLDQPNAGSVVNELADKSLLTPIGPDAMGEPRYRLHDLLYDYAREMLAEEPPQERKAALKRAVAAWLQLASLADDALPAPPYFPRSAPTQMPMIISAGTAELVVANPIAWFTSERLNLADVAKRAATSGWHELAIELASRLASFQHFQNRNDDAIQLWNGIMESASKFDDHNAVAVAQLRYAAALIERGQASDAKGLLDGCVEEFERAGNELALSYAMYWRAAYKFDLGYADLSLRDAEMGVALSARIGNRHGEFLNLRALGWALAVIGHGDRGVEACERAVSIALELGEQSYELVALSALSLTCHLAGQDARAVRFSTKLLADSSELGDVRERGLALGILGDAYHGLGRYREAVSALHEALQIFRRHANRRYYALCLLKLGYASQELGEYDRAVEYFEASLPIFGELRLSHFEERARERVADSVAATQIDPARRCSRRRANDTSPPLRLG